MRQIPAGDYSEGDNPGYPWFKKQVPARIFRIPQGFWVKDRHIYLPKLGGFRFYKSCEIRGVPKNVIVVRKGPQWHIYVQVERKI